LTCGSVQSYNPIVILLSYSNSHFLEIQLSFAIGRIRLDSDSGRSNRVSLIKKYRVTGWIRVNLFRGGSGFGSNIVRFFWISGQAGSGIWFLVAQVILGFETFGSGSSRVSDHLISGNFRLGRVGFFFVMFYFGSDQISGRVGFRVVIL
jgi:hypothetical protein